MGLIDEALGDDLYPIIKIDRKDQTYDKQDRLTDAFSRLEGELGSIVGSFTSLDLLANSRNLMMQKFNSALAKAMIWPFVADSPVPSTRLSELFVPVDTYRPPAARIEDGFVPRRRSTRWILP